MSLQYKLLAIFLFLFVLPIIIFGYVSMTNFEYVLKKNAYQYNDERLATSSEHVSAIISQLNGTVLALEADKDFNQWLQNVGTLQDGIDYYKDTDAIYNRLSDIIVQNTRIMSLYLYLPTGKSYCVNFKDSIDRGFSPQQESWYQAAMSGYGPVILTRYTDEQSAGKQENLISYVDGLENGGQRYVLQFNFSASVLDSLISASDVDATSIVLAQGNTVLVSRGDFPGSIEDVLNETGGVFTGEMSERVIDGRQVLISGRKNPDTGWWVLAFTDSAQLMKDTNDFITLLIVLAAAMIPVMIFLSFTISRVISRPIRSMERIIDEVKRGEPGKEYAIAGPPARGLIKEEYNSFVGTINDLIRQINLSMKKQQEQELEILQAQINPHFIYNTLSTLKWTAHMEGSKRIEDVTGAIINLLKSSIRMGQPYQTISDEIGQLRDYMTVQLLRYDDKFKVDFAVEEGVENCRTLKFILQPIVENAIFHGLDMDSGDARLSIRIERQQEIIVSTIQDNGAGMSRAMIENILADNIAKSSLTSIGIYNVNQRIKRYFGAQYGLSIHSEPGTGTCVTVVIPAIPEDNAHESIDRR
jgi:two-component system sensor histidine kinase YesM